MFVLLTYLHVHTVVQMGFAMDKVNISENGQLVSISVNKIGDTVLTTKVNLTRAYNTTGKSQTQNNTAVIIVCLYIIYRYDGF